MPMLTQKARFHCDGIFAFEDLQAICKKQNVKKAIQRYNKEALQLYEKMLHSGINPDKFTFLQF